MAEQKKDEKKGIASKFTDIRIKKERRCIADFFVQTGYNFTKTVKILKDNLYDYTESHIRSSIYEVLTGKKDVDINSLSHDMFQIEILRFVQRKAVSVVQEKLPLAKQKDPKLKSLPFVYTKKIDDMSPFKQEYTVGLSGLTSKEANFSGVTDIIVKESKPVMRKLPTCVWMKARGSAEKWMKVVQRVELFNKNCRLYRSNASTMPTPVVITQATRSITPLSRSTTVDTSKVLSEYQKGYIKRAKTAILLRDDYSKEVNIYVINNKVLIHYAIENMQYYQCDFKVVIKSCCWVKRDRQIEQKLFKQLRMDRGMLKLIMNKHNCVDKCNCCCSEANKAAQNTPSGFTTTVKVETLKEDPDTLTPRTFEDKLATPKDLLARTITVNTLPMVKKEKCTYESLYMCYPDGLEVEYQISSDGEIVKHLLKNTEFSMKQKQCCWMALPKSIPDTLEAHIHEELLDRLPHPCPIGNCQCCCQDQSSKISLDDINLSEEFSNIGIDIINASETNQVNSNIRNEDSTTSSLNEEVFMCSKPSNPKKYTRKRGKKTDFKISTESNYTISIKPFTAPTANTIDDNSTEVLIKSELLDFEEHFPLPIKTDIDMELDKKNTAHENTTPHKSVMIPISTVLDQAPGTQVWVTNLKGKLAAGVHFAPSPISHIIMNALASALAQVKIYVKTLSLPEGKIYINDIIRVGNVCMDIGEWANSEEEFLSIVGQSQQELAGKLNNMNTAEPSVCLPVVEKVYSLNSGTEQTLPQSSKRKAGESPLLVEALTAKPKKVCPNNFKLTQNLDSHLSELLDKWPSNGNSSLRPQSQQSNAGVVPNSTHNENISTMSNGKDNAIKTEILSDDEIKSETLNASDIEPNDMIGL